MILAEEITTGKPVKIDLQKGGKVEKKNLTADEAHIFAPEKQSPLELNFGSDIIINDSAVGFSTGLKYQWSAHANADYPNTIFINKHKIWFECGSRRLIRKLSNIISHETIHNILWYMIEIKNMTSHDRIIQPFKKQIKKECPKTHTEYMI